MKLADITPVHKKKESTNKTNYRPVSILSSTSKFFEKLINMDLINYIDKYLSNNLYVDFVKVIVPNTH